MILSGVYGIEHIIYLIIVLILGICSLILIKKKCKSEKSIILLVRISALVLLIIFIMSRIFITYSDVCVNHRENYTWLNLIPNTWCSMSCLVLCIALLCGKKNNLVLHYVSYIAALGGLITILYPDFLETQAFFDPRSITGLIYHTGMLWLVCVIFITNYFVPELKKWYIYPIGLMINLTFGLFEKEALNFVKAMQINEPLLKSLPHFTSWYSVGVLSIIIELIILVLIEYLRKKKNKKNAN